MGGVSNACDPGWLCTPTSSCCVLRTMPHTRQRPLHERQLAASLQQGMCHVYHESPLCSLPALKMLKSSLMPGSLFVDATLIAAVCGISLLPICLLSGIHPSLKHMSLFCCYLAAPYILYPVQRIMRDVLLLMVGWAKYMPA